MPIKTFRGKIADGAIETIPLHTNDGSVGYKIVKFLCMPDTPGTNQTEAILNLFTVPQTTAVNTIDFSDQTLIGSIFQATSNGSNEAFAEEIVIVFDNMIFNQDLFLTAKEKVGARDTNYHIELEQVKLDLNQNTVATLKDIRNNA